MYRPKEVFYHYQGEKTHKIFLVSLQETYQKEVQLMCLLEMLELEKITK